MALLKKSDILLGIDEPRKCNIEALGGDVDKTVEDLFECKILYAQNGKLPEYLMFVGGLLYDKK